MERKVPHLYQNCHRAITRGGGGERWGITDRKRFSKAFCRFTIFLHFLRKTFQMLLEFYNMGHVYMLSVHSALGHTLQQWERITKRLGCIHGSGPEVILFVLYSSQLSMNFILRRINECLKIALTFMSRLR